MLDWQRIDSVFLDMDGTLLDLHFDNHFWQQYLPECYARRHRLPLAEARERLASAYDDVAGTLDWYCLDYWRQQLQMDIIGLKEELRHLIAIRPSVHDFLASLRQRGKRTILLSNAHPDSLALKMRATGLAPCFDRLISCHTIGLPKEADGFWSRLHEEEPYRAERCLLIDDNLTVLDRAAEAGIGQLLTITSPDSRQPARGEARYPMIDDFRQLITELP